MGTKSTSTTRNSDGTTTRTTVHSDGSGKSVTTKPGNIVTGDKFVGSKTFSGK